MPFDFDRLRPSTQKAVALAAEVKTLQKEKEHLRINLHKAEDEVSRFIEGEKAFDLLSIM